MQGRDETTFVCALLALNVFMFVVHCFGSSGVTLSHLWCLGGSFIYLCQRRHARPGKNFEHAHGSFSANDILVIRLLAAKGGQKDGQKESEFTKMATVGVLVLKV